MRNLSLTLLFSLLLACSPTPESSHRSSTPTGSALQSQLVGGWPEGEEWCLELRSALLESQSLDLLSLDPDIDPTQSKPDIRFYGFVELGRAKVEGTAAKKLASSLVRSIDASDGRRAACFNPRHGVIVKNFDLSICFECLGVAVYRNGKALGILTITDEAQPGFEQAVSTRGLKTVVSP